MKTLDLDVLAMVVAIADAGSFVIYAIAVLILLVRPAGLYGRE